MNVQPSVSMKGQFGPNGALFDGWESRRHNPTYDWCALPLPPLFLSSACTRSTADALSVPLPARRTIIKLGALGEVVGCDIDTGHFAGNECVPRSLFLPQLPLMMISRLMSGRVERTGRRRAVCGAQTSPRARRSRRTRRSCVALSLLLSWLCGILAVELHSRPLWDRQLTTVCPLARSGRRSSRAPLSAQRSATSSSSPSSRRPSRTSSSAWSPTAASAASAPTAASSRRPPRRTRRARPSTSRTCSTAAPSRARATSTLGAAPT